jgi:hypothetical protein
MFDLPEHAFPSSSREYPSKQEQMYDPIVLLHTCVQLCPSCSHSLTSVLYNCKRISSEIWYDSLNKINSLKYKRNQIETEIILVETNIGKYYIVTVHTTVLYLHTQFYCVNTLVSYNHSRYALRLNREYDICKNKIPIMLYIM